MQSHSRWTVDEFKAICQRTISLHGHAKFSLMVTGLGETQATRRAEKQMYYHTLAIRIDRACMLAFTALYTLTLVALHAWRPHMS